MEVHPYKSQILIEAGPGERTLEKALAILEELNIHQVQYQILEEGAPPCILLLFSDKDMREAAFRLTEAGFTRVKGINPQS